MLLVILSSVPLIHPLFLIPHSCPPSLFHFSPPRPSRARGPNRVKKSGCDNLKEGLLCLIQWSPVPVAVAVVAVTLRLYFSLRALVYPLLSLLTVVAQHRDRYFCSLALLTTTVVDTSLSIPLPRGSYFRLVRRAIIDPLAPSSPPSPGCLPTHFWLQFHGHKFFQNLPTPPRLFFSFFFALSPFIHSIIHFFLTGTWANF
ncbi:uncharacterized protein BDV14DRAFT_163333 [Aspergillus stella-maris]|uniref:uncharacterized protein n=1 Tax=Aspergillus stella-maris TaxID=1810926 RepID=UPI003CCD6336